MKRNPLFEGVAVPHVADPETIKRRFPRFDKETLALMDDCLGHDPATRAPCSKLLSGAYFDGFHEWWAQEFKRLCEKDQVRPLARTDLGAAVSRAARRWRRRAEGGRRRAEWCALAQVNYRGRFKRRQKGSKGGSQQQPAQNQAPQGAGGKYGTGKYDSEPRDPTVSDAEVSTALRGRNGDAVPLAVAMATRSSDGVLTARGAEAENRKKLENQRKQMELERKAQMESLAELKQIEAANAKREKEKAARDDKKRKAAEARNKEKAAIRDAERRDAERMLSVPPGGS
jgi:hypothetical protein